ncbi:hypothetical protein CCP3SC15_300013 [Gammaproteobacteria bacterium]
MTRNDFIKQAIAAGKTKEEIRAVFKSIEEKNGFDDSPAPATPEQPAPEPEYSYTDALKTNLGNAWKKAGKEAVETTQRRASDFRAIDAGGAGGPLMRSAAKFAGGAVSAYEHAGQAIGAGLETLIAPFSAAFTPPAGRKPETGPRLPPPAIPGTPFYAQPFVGGPESLPPMPSFITKPLGKVAQHFQNLPPEEKAINKTSMEILGALPFGPAGKAVKTAVQGSAKAATKGLSETAQEILSRIRSTIDPQVGAVATPDGGLKRLKDMTADDVRALVDDVLKSPEMRGKATGGDIESLKDEVVTAMKNEMVQLRRDIRENPLTKQELAAATKGKLDEPLQAGGVPESVPKIDKTGPAGWGRMINDRLLKGLSDKQAHGTPDFDKLVNMARAYKLDRSMDNPLVVAGEKSLGEAFKNFDSKIGELADSKEYLLQASSAKIDISEMKKQWIESVRKVARAEIGEQQVRDELGNIVTRRALKNPEHGHKIDPDSDAAIIEITDALLDAPDILSAKHADDLKRFIQHRRYSSVGMIPDIADRLSGDFAGRLNRQLQKDLGDRYKVINQNLRDYIGLEEILARSLGKPVDVEQGIHRNVAAVMKAAGSGITRTDLQVLFRKVKELSAGNFDPYQAAAYAEAAMKVVGDEPVFSLGEMMAGGADVAKAALPGNLMGKINLAINAGPKLIGRAASGGKDDADFLVDYWLKAQRRGGPEGPAPSPHNPNEPFTPAGPFDQLLQTPRMSKENIEALAKIGYKPPEKPWPKPKAPPAAADPSTENPFWDLPKATRDNDPERLARAQAEMNKAAGLGDEAFNPPPFETALDPIDETALARSAANEGAQAAHPRSVTGQNLRNDLFPDIRGEIKKEKLSPQKLRQLSVLAERPNSMHTHDYTQWLEVYGKEGWPDKEDLSPDDIIQWINETTTGTKKRGVFGSERGAVGSEEMVGENFNLSTLTPAQWNKVSSYMKRNKYDYRGGEDARNLMMRKRSDGTRIGMTDDQRKAIAYAIGFNKPAKTPQAQNVSKVKRYFGVTENPNIAGYITGDGKMLDFSGRRQGNTGATTRALDHRDIGAVIEDSPGGTEGMRLFMREGNIRMDYNAGTFDIAAAPSPEQFKTIDKLIASNKNDDITIDLENGAEHFNKQYDSRTPKSTILKDIHAFYSGPKKSESNLSKLRSTSEPSFDSYGRIGGTAILGGMAALGALGATAIGVAKAKEKR